MTNNIARWSLIGSSFLALALVACSGGAEVGQGPQAGGGATTEAVHADLAAGHHDPAAFVKRFDANGDGALEVAELPERMQKWIGDADADRDGKISVAELDAHRQAMKARMFQKADKNGDGALDANEVGPKRWEHLKVADADGNGSVTAAEIQTARQSGVLRGGAHQGHERGKWLARLDKNGDGTVTQDECDARVWQHVSRADANADGRVTKEELQQARPRRAEAR